MLDLVAGADRLEKYALARLITVAEGEGEAAHARRVELFRHLDGRSAPGVVLGVTGTPGAGKSSLIARMALALVAEDPRVRIAVLAIDPTSEVSGGALLGDRVRARFPAGEARLCFRSQPAEGDLGGLGRRTFAATRLLRHFVDLIIIETVGIGQNEIDVDRLADRSCLVLQPLAGDHVQFMKAGVMEIPDIFIINKCDEERLARRSLRELETALDYARIGKVGPRTIVLTSAVTGRGLPEMVGIARALMAAPPSAEVVQARSDYFLVKRVREAYGRFGLDVLASLPRDPRASFEERETAALAAIARKIGS